MKGIIAGLCLLQLPSKNAEMEISPTPDWKHLLDGRDLTLLHAPAHSLLMHKAACIGTLCQTLPLVLVKED